MIKKTIYILSILFTSFSYTMDMDDENPFSSLDALFDPHNRQNDHVQFYNPDDVDNEPPIPRASSSRHTGLPPRNSGLLQPKKNQEIKHEQPLTEKEQLEQFRKQQKRAQKDLFHAALRGNIDGIQKALNNGAFVNGQNRGGFTALLLAFQMQRYDTAIFLIEQGADVSGADYYGNTLLHGAVGSNYLALVQAIYNAGGDPHAANRPLGRTPMSIAQQEMKNDMVRAMRSPRAYNVSQEKTVDL